MNELMIPSASAIDMAVDIIRTGHEKAQEIPAEVMRAGAILALQVGANPNPIASELWIIQLKGKWTPYLGIAYYRRIAEENNTRVMFTPAGMTGDRMEGTPRAMTDEERQQYKVPEKTLASICRGFRGDQLLELLDRGVPWRDAVALLTRVAVAYLTDDEMKDRQGQYMKPPNGRSWQWKCDKRAEVDLYRKLGVVARKPDPAKEEAKRAAAREGIEEGQYTLEQLNADLF